MILSIVLDLGELCYQGKKMKLKTQHLHTPPGSLLKLKYYGIWTCSQRMGKKKHFGSTISSSNHFETWKIQFSCAPKTTVHLWFLCV